MTVLWNIQSCWTILYHLLPWRHSDRFMHSKSWQATELHEYRPLYVRG